MCGVVLEHGDIGEFQQAVKAADYTHSIYVQIAAQLLQIEKIPGYFPVTGEQERDLLTVRPAPGRVAVDIAYIEFERPIPAQALEFKLEIFTEVAALPAVERQLRCHGTGP